jgi:hypothetical protein
MTTMSVDLPPGVTIAPPPPELELGGEVDDDWRSYRRAQPTLSHVQAAKALPQPLAAGSPDVLRTATPFACSGGVDSRRCREATKFRLMSEMAWEEARVALHRLIVALPYSDGGRAADHVALAAFALTADGHEGFVGLKGDHAVKLRDELTAARERLRRRLEAGLAAAKQNASQLAPQHSKLPIIWESDTLTEHLIRQWIGALNTMQPVAIDRWVRLTEATGDEVLAALAYLRAEHAIWEARRPVAGQVIRQLATTDLPSAQQYAEALHIAEMLVFMTEKLLSLYAGIMVAMPIYRLYPAVSEAEAVQAWWPWGRPAPLVDGGPPKPPRARKKTFDPAQITATRPQDVVREVMTKGGINRTTAQRMTARMRREMRSNRYWQAKRLLMGGKSQAEAARLVGLSPSRISALFKGEQFPQRRRGIRPISG